jgi:hypothetical protein
MSQAQTAAVDVDLYLHVRVLVSIILGLSVTRLVSGVARLIQHPARYRMSLIHLGWVAWALVNVFGFWWFEFRLSLVGHWNLALYFFVCLFASMYYFLSVLLFPDDIDGYDGYQDYFLSRRVWFFGFVALSEALDLVDTRIKGAEYMQSMGTEYFAHFGVMLMLCAIAASTRNLAFHAAFVISSLLYEISYFVRAYYDLS